MGMYDYVEFIDRDMLPKVLQEALDNKETCQTDDVYCELGTLFVYKDRITYQGGICEKPLHDIKDVTEMELIFDTLEGVAFFKRGVFQSFCMYNKF